MNARDSMLESVLDAVESLAEAISERAVYNHEGDYETASTAHVREMRGQLGEALRAYLTEIAP